jgi:hypothetical protein
MPELPFVHPSRSACIGPNSIPHPGQSCSNCLLTCPQPHLAMSSTEQRMLSPHLNPALLFLPREGSICCCGPDPAFLQFEIRTPVCFWRVAGGLLCAPTTPYLALCGLPVCACHLPARRPKANAFLGASSPASATPCAPLCLAARLVFQAPRQAMIDWRGRGRGRECARRGSPRARTPSRAVREVSGRRPLVPHLRSESLRPPLRAPLMI